MCLAVTWMMKAQILDYTGLGALLHPLLPWQSHRNREEQEKRGPGERRKWML